MKWIFSSDDTSELSRFKSMMERADIPCVVRKTQLDLPMPLAPLDSELWVVNDEDYPKASGLVKGWSHPSRGDSVDPRLGYNGSQQFAIRRLCLARGLRMVEPSP